MQRPTADTKVIDALTPSNVVALPVVRSAMPPSAAKDAQAAYAAGALATLTQVADLLHEDSVGDAALVAQLARDAAADDARLAELHDLAAVATASRAAEEEAWVRREQARAELQAAAITKALATRTAPALVSGDKPFDAALAAEWCAAWRKDDATINTYTTTYFNHWRAHFGTLGGMLVERAWDRYISARLAKAKGVTVDKEIISGRVFLRWAKSADMITAVPELPQVDKRAGTIANPNRKREAIDLEPEVVASVIALMPEWSTGHIGRESATRFLVRPYFEVMAHTGLRRSTLNLIESPADWRVGARELGIRDEIDKARFGRKLPVDSVVAEILDQCSPQGGGIIFGRHDRRKYLYEAAKQHGLDEYSARHLSNHDFRHSRSQFESDSGVPLTAIAYLRGWKRISTADEYIKPSKKRAAEALARLESAGRGATIQCSTS